MQMYKINKGVRVAKWYGAGFLSQQPGLDSRPKKNHHKPPGVPFMTSSRKAYLKIFKKNPKHADPSTSIDITSIL